MLPDLIERFNFAGGDGEVVHIRPHDLQGSPISMLTRATIGDNGDARGCSNINRQIDLGTALVGLRDLSICHQEEA